MMDIEALKKRLEQKQEIDCGITRGFREKYPPLGAALYDMRAVEDAIATIEQLQRELEAVKIDCDTFRHGHRIASDNCVRLERELEDARKDAARYQFLKENVRGGSFGLMDGWIDDDTAKWDGWIDAAREKQG